MTDNPTRNLVSADSLQRFISAGEAYCNWFDHLDPESCTSDQIAAKLSSLLGAKLGPCNSVTRPRYRNFKPNEEWQRNQRKALGLPMNGCRTPLLPNDDGVAFTLCSLAYDLCD